MLSVGKAMTVNKLKCVYRSQISQHQCSEQLAQAKQRDGEAAYQEHGVLWKVSKQLHKQGCTKWVVCHRQGLEEALPQMAFSSLAPWEHAPAACSFPLRCPMAQVISTVTQSAAVCKGAGCWNTSSMDPSPPMQAHAARLVFIPELWKAHTHRATCMLCSVLPADFQVNSTAERPAGRGHGPVHKGSRKENKRCQGWFGKHQQADKHHYLQVRVPQISTPPALLHKCDTNGSSDLLQRGRTVTGNKKPQNSENCRSQLWMRNPQKSLGKERLCLREQLTLFTPEEVEESREVSQGQSKHTTWQTTNAQLEQERLKFKSWPTDNKIFTWVGFDPCGPLPSQNILLLPQFWNS